MPHLEKCPHCNGNRCEVRYEKLYADPSIRIMNALAGSHNFPAMPAEPVAADVRRRCLDCDFEDYRTRVMLI